MKVVPRKPHIYLIDVALRPFQEKDEGRFYLPFITAETYTIEENKSYDGTSSGSHEHPESGQMLESSYAHDREKDPDAARRNREMRE
jgi:hypothetical protein